VAVTDHAVVIEHAPGKLLNVLGVELDMQQSPIDKLRQQVGPERPSKPDP
jgi:hypothetical protein